MWKCKIGDSIVMLRESKDGPLWIVVPDDNVRIVSLLTWGNKMSLIGDGHTCYQIIMSSQKVLVMWIIQISGDYTASSNENILLRIWMKKHRVINSTTEPDGVIKLNHLIILLLRNRLVSRSLRSWCQFGLWLLLLLLLKLLTLWKLLFLLHIF